MSRRLALCSVLAAAGCDQVFQLERPPAELQFIGFVQTAHEIPTDKDIVSVKYLAAQAAGNLNVAAVGWTGSARVVSVADQNGEYEPAVAPLMIGSIRQGIYYRGNIGAAAAGTNAITVTFSESTEYPDIRIIEYSGIDPDEPFEAGTGSVGNGMDMNSGNLVTRGEHRLLVGAATVDGVTTAAGAGFINRVITSNGNMLEDQEVFEQSTYVATGTHSATSGWIMQIAAFRGF